ncbi:hypothetical protein QFC19_000587 [Naganishia cerealis]|uniref:Uncharacterized protein n=1 Tax=Naganishia cerealis TaxID=610337 RepID=A0ACC2WLF3_9TREE|nr:hypothetical protein QFC19_000587 [Naganishia cerealis]
MHLPDHIANLNSYSPTSPPPNPFPNIFGFGGSSGTQNGEQSGSYQNHSEVDSSLDAQLARQLELWTNTDFTFDDDIGPFPGLEEFDVGGEASDKNAEKDKNTQNEDEMDMREMFEGKVRGMKGNKNVLLDRRREMEMEQQEKSANPNHNTRFNDEMDHRTSNGSTSLATANRAAAAAVDGMPTPNNSFAPPPTPSLLGLQNLAQLQTSQHQQHPTTQQPNLNAQANDLASFLSQFYNSNALVPSNAQSQMAQQPQQTPTQQPMQTPTPQPAALPQFQATQQAVPPKAQVALNTLLVNPSQNPSIAESLVQLLQGFTGQYNAQSQQQCPAPPVVMPQPVAAPHNMSQVAQWVERHTPQNLGQRELHPLPPIIPSTVDRPQPAQKRSFAADESDMQVSAAKKARLPVPPPPSEDVNSVDVNDSENDRRTSSAAVSVAGDFSTTRKPQVRATPSRVDADLEPKSIPMGKGLVMVDGEIITHEEE